MGSKKLEPKWFIRATTIDKANGPVHNMVTTHATYAHAAQHLTTGIGAERGLGVNSGYTKGKTTFQILPIQKQLKQGNTVKKNEQRVESLNEFVERVTTRSRKQIVEDAEQRAFQKSQDPGQQQPDPMAQMKSLKKPSKVTPEPPETGTNKKTITGEKPNKIEKKPSLDSVKAGDSQSILPSNPGSHGSY